jgi:hypothetical protein
LLCGTPTRYYCPYKYHNPSSDDSQSDAGELDNDADDEGKEKENIDPAAVSPSMIYVSLLCLICKSKNLTEC